MLQRVHLSVILIFAAAIWGVMLVIEGVAVSGKWFRPFSTVVGVVLLLLVAFDLWAWRWRMLHGWFVPRPDVRGTWRVELRSEWKNPETGQTIAPIAAYMVVRQTFSTLSVRMLTEESLSELVAAEISKATDGTYRIAAVYRNEPALSVRHRSPIHYGALVLDVQGDPVVSLAGHYWTDRNTRGEIRTLGRISTIASSFAHASELFPVEVVTGPSNAIEKAQ
jgi:SMODS-associating 2TM, beta-strand rich effector domain